MPAAELEATPGSGGGGGFALATAFAFASAASAEARSSGSSGGGADSAEEALETARSAAVPASGSALLRSRVSGLYAGSPDSGGSN